MFTDNLSSFCIPRVAENYTYSRSTSITPYYDNICMYNIVATKWSTEIYLAHEYFLNINNRKITESKGLYNCVKAETKTYTIPVYTSADFCTLSVSICFPFSVFVYVPVLVFKSRLQTNGIYSVFLNAIQIVDLKSS